MTTPVTDRSDQRAISSRMPEFATDPCSTHEKTVACRLTAHGRGAIAVIGVHGKNSHASVLKCFAPATPLSNSSFPSAAVRYGVWTGPTDAGSSGYSKPSGLATESETPLSDTRVASSINAPQNPRGESVVVCATGPWDVEVHCHGGKAAVEAILEDLKQVGADVVDPAAFEIARQRPAEIVAMERMLQQTNTATTAAIVLTQLRGAFANECRHLAHLLETRRDAARDYCQNRIGKLIGLWPVAQHLIHPWNIVIAGPPNVGKSSLLNRILGYKRTITFDAPGTTRDVISTDAAIGGWPVRISDTAGIRSSLDEIESQGVNLALKTLSNADLVLLVVDAQEGLTAMHQTIAQQCECPTAVIVNKIDLPGYHQDTSLQWQTERKRPVVLVSARTGEGIDQLLTCILDLLMPTRPTFDEPIPILQQHYELLTQTITCTDIQQQISILRNHY